MKRKVKITREDITNRLERKVKITRENLFRPVALINIVDGETVSFPEIDICAKGHPNCVYRLKLNTLLFYATANNIGEFVFRQIKLSNEQNLLEISNHNYQDIENQKVKLSVVFDKLKLRYIGLNDPLVGKKFSINDNTSSIIRCKKCKTFHFKSTVREYGRCSICKDLQFWEYRDKEFHQDYTTDRA